MTIIKRQTVGPEPTPVPDGYAVAFPAQIQWRCLTCGAAVADEKLHTEWHQANKD